MAKALAEQAQLRHAIPDITVAQGCTVAIAQSYNNCPQYIWPGVAQPQSLVPTVPATAAPVPAALAAWPDAVRALVARADTFFVSSRHDVDPDDPGARENGVDVSHRGGRAGFIALDGDALVWPEYRGNWYFNTLGNLPLDPCCGWLIPDFASGDVLQLSG